MLCCMFTWTWVCVSPLWTSAGRASAAPHTCRSPVWTWRTGCPLRWWSSSSPGGSARSPRTWWSWWIRWHTPAHTPWRLLQSAEKRNTPKLFKRFLSHRRFTKQKTSIVYSHIYLQAVFRLSLLEHCCVSRHVTTTCHSVEQCETISRKLSLN